jgi:glycosyltransferase involved in cell wall biosynthesis
MALVSSPTAHVVPPSRLFYLANVRMPTEKAHGLQIMQMCEAFARAGDNLRLIVPRRINTAEMSAIADAWAYYGVARNFAMTRIPCLDLFRWILPDFPPAAFATEMLRTATYILAMLPYLLFHPADVYYSRDLLTLLVLSLFRPRRALVYEVHQLMKSPLGELLQRWCARRVGLVVAVTARLADDLAARGAKHTVVAHDGYRLERFADLPDRQTARVRLNLPGGATIVGYVGQLHTMSMGKGIDSLIDAIASADRPISLCLTGGPAAMAEALRSRWLRLGLPADRFLFTGQVEPSVVPVCLAALDICAMPFPWTEHFAYYASPLKLFEYMASGGTILASDLPSTAEVVRDGESALLVPPGNVEALAAALRRLYDDPALRERLGAAARQLAPQYSWQARAERILSAIRIDTTPDQLL